MGQIPLLTYQRRLTVNMKKLVEIGKNLLKKTVSRINLQTGLLEPCQHRGSNEEALKRYIQNSLLNITIHLLDILYSKSNIKNLFNLLGIIDLT